MAADDHAAGRVGPAAGSAVLRVRVFGPCEVDGIPATAIGSRKAGTLLKVLALAGGGWVGVDRLVECDPVGAAAHIRQSLKPDGTWLLIEPYANDELADNLNLVGRIFYSASTTLCVPAPEDQEAELSLGAQAGEARLRDVVLAGGFRDVRRASETPFNLVLEARP